MTHALTDREKKFIFIETLGSVLWLIMDRCWIQEDAQLAMWLAYPAIFVNFISFFYVEKRVVFLYISLVTNFWVLMDVFGMFGEFKEIGNFYLISDLFFLSSMVLVCLVFLRFFSSDKSEIELLFFALSKFRRLRVFKIK